MPLIKSNRLGILRIGVARHPVEIAFVGTCLLLILSLNFLSLAFKTSTYDEPWHLKNGLRFLQGNTERFQDSKMPVSALNALPVALMDHIPSEDAHLDDFVLELGDRSLRAARLVTVLGSLLLAIVVYCWSRALYGPLSAGLSLVLYTFSPNLLAHSRPHHYRSSRRPSDRPLALDVASLP